MTDRVRVRVRVTNLAPSAAELGSSSGRVRVTGRVTDAPGGSDGMSALDRRYGKKVGMRWQGRGRRVWELNCSCVGGFR